MDKTEYILRSLSKIRHKKWELYIVSRIWHGINDPEIEFVCQQLVRVEGKTRLLDLFFPQFGIYLEINEPYHGTKENPERDKRRTQEIVAVTKLIPHEIIVYEQKNDSLPVCRDLKEIDDKADDFVDEIRRRKAEQVANGRFKAWDYEARFSPEPHIKLGKIDVDNGAVFRTHKHALQCFGYEGGNLMKGSWPYKKIDGTCVSCVWFPKLYENKDWVNSISEDGATIHEKRRERPDEYVEESAKKKDRDAERIVFAHETDSLGYTLYSFKGVFQRARSQSQAGGCVVYERIRKDQALPLISPAQVHMSSECGGNQPAQKVVEEPKELPDDNFDDLPPLYATDKNDPKNFAFLRELRRIRKSDPSLYRKIINMD